MNYIPIIHTINKSNVFAAIRTFIKTWYEIEIIQPKNKLDFGERLQIEISQNVNEALNLLLDLSNSLTSGNKNISYTGFEYVFTTRNLKIGYNKELEFLFLMQEGKQDFYFGIAKNELLKENPKITRIVRNSKEISHYDDYNLIDFLINNICTRASKIKTREYVNLLSRTDLAKSQLEKLAILFCYKSTFGDFEIYENDDVVAAILDKKENDYILVSINKWTEKQSDITKHAIEIFEWKGWSDNNYRFKL